MRSTRHNNSLRRRRLAAAAAAVLLASGCGSADKEETMHPTMTAVEAQSTIDRLINEAVAQLPGSAALRPRHKKTALPCELFAGAEGDPVFVEHDYEIKDLPSDKYSEYFNRLKEYWESRGYRRTRLDQKGERYWEMVYGHPDGYNLTFTANLVDKRLFIAGQSPCLKPDR